MSSDCCGAPKVLQTETQISQEEPATQTLEIDEALAWRYHAAVAEAENAHLQVVNLDLGYDSLLRKHADRRRQMAEKAATLDAVAQKAAQAIEEKYNVTMQGCTLDGALFTGNAQKKVEADHGN